jgi:fermentation-respiration switch protein FrsA (DUF1100 family)
VKQALTRVASWVVLFIVMFNGWLYLQQPNITFYPYAELAATPKQWGLAYEDVSLLTEDKQRLHGWFLPHPGASRTLLFFHGNGGNISHRGASLKIFHRLGLNVLIIDYRGYGRSEGSPDEPGLYLDAMAAWRYLTQTRGISPDSIIIFGRSLGGAVATWLASEVEPAALILESTFSTARDMADHIYPLLSNVLYLRYRFDSESSIKKLQSPLYMAHSRNDEIIPYHLGRKLYAAAPQPKQFFELRGGHNVGFMQSQPDYERGLEKFLRQLEAGSYK